MNKLIFTSRNRNMSGFFYIYQKKSLKKDDTEKEIPTT